MARAPVKTGEMQRELFAVAGLTRQWEVVQTGDIVRAICYGVLHRIPPDRQANHR